MCNVRKLTSRLHERCWSSSRGFGQCSSQTSCNKTKTSKWDIKQVRIDDNRTGVKFSSTLYTAITKSQCIRLDITYCWQFWYSSQLNRCLRLYQHSQFSITLLININYWSVSKTAKINASRPKSAEFRSLDQDRSLEDYKTPPLWTMHYSVINLYVVI